MSSGSSTDVDLTGWHTFYPNYCNSEKTVPEGRRLGKENCVPHPSALELAEAAQELRLPVKLEMNKAYPRDWMVRGRVKVLIKKEDGTFLNTNITTKRDFLKKACAVIKGTKKRVDAMKDGKLAVPKDPIMVEVEKVQTGGGQPKKNEEKKAAGGKKKKK